MLTLFVTLKKDGDRQPTTGAAMDAAIRSAEKMLPMLNPERPITLYRPALESDDSVAGACWTYDIPGTRWYWEASFRVI